MTAVLEETRRDPRFSKLQAVRRGADFSVFKALATASMAGTLPDLGMVEASELPALEASGLAQPIPPELARSLLKGLSPEWIKSGKTASGVQLSLPYERILPVLLVDQEMLYRVGINPEAPLPNWKEIQTAAQKLTTYFRKVRSEQSAVNIPLQGARGLWLLEALTAHPLWNRKTGGLSANRKLIPDFDKIREMTSDKDRAIQAHVGWERALQDFIDRRSPIVVSSSDALPRVRAEAAFRWKAIPLPRLDGKPSRLATGSNWVMLQDSPAVRELLTHLYSPGFSDRWMRAGGYLSLRGTLNSSEDSSPDLGLGGPDKKLERLSFRGQRSTDPTVVQARSAWIQALNPLFGTPSRRRGVEEVLTRLDRQINSGSSD